MTQAKPDLSRSRAGAPGKADAADWRPVSRKSRGRGKSVVLADNNPSLREAVGGALEERGYTVHPASDGLECLLAIRSARPDVAILDILMPKIDGSRVCSLIRQDRTLRHTPIIAFSALSPKDIQRFPELSADAYVAKGSTDAVGQTILEAIAYLESRDREDLTGGIFGYQGFRPEKLAGEMLRLRRRYEGLMRAFACGVMELDPAGRILMANARALEMARRQEFRLVGEAFPSIFPLGTRARLEELLRDLARARLPEERRITATLASRDTALRFFATLEEGKCVGLLVTLEPTPPPGRVRE